MPNGTACLGWLRMQAQQRSDTENNPAISTPEWNGYLSNSYKELFDLLVGAYGNDYYVALPYQFSLTGSQFYPFPDGSANFLVNSLPAAPFYKLLGVDLQYSGSPSGWVSLRRYEFIDRNKYAYPNTTVNINGYTNLKYRPVGNQLELIPIPATSQLARIWYIPEPVPLQLVQCAAMTNTSPVITVADITGITAGMSVYSSAGIPSGTTVLSVNTSLNQVTLSANATSTLPVQVVLFWIDSTLMDGIAGWEEYVVIDAAIKAATKVENATDGLILQKADMKKRIEAMAEGRDAGQAAHVSDALSINGFGMDDQGDGLGGGFNGGSWGGY